MTGQNVRGTLLAVLIGAIMAAAVIFLSPTAKANPEQDYIYYALLEGNGFSITDPQVMKRNAQILCAEMERGTDWRLTVARLMSEGNYTLDESTTILAAAIIAYCPHTAPPEMTGQQVA